MWLIKKNGTKAKAHIWTGTDTVCRMASTGGLTLSRFEVRKERGDHEVCSMCSNGEADHVVELCPSCLERSGCRLCAQAQADGRSVGLLATEILDIPYMERVGIDTRNLPVFLGTDAATDTFACRQRLPFGSASVASRELQHATNATEHQEDGEASEGRRSGAGTIVHRQHHAWSLSCARPVPHCIALYDCGVCFVSAPLLPGGGGACSR